MNKNKKKVSNIMLVIIIIAIVLYTAATFLLQYFAGAEVSPTLTTAWFSFWGAEIVALAGIKISKVAKGEESYEEPCEYSEEDCDL